MASERELVSKIIALTGIANDDATLVQFGAKKLAITTDISFSSSHSPPSLAYYRMGWRSAVSNLSDVAAMGAKPLAFLLAQGLPAGVAERASLGIVRGAKDACKVYNANYVGGDTKKANEITLAGFALGEIVGRPLLRKNARAGDIICVSGAIGNAFCGFHALMHKTKSPANLLNAFIKPRALVSEGMLISRNAKRAACMDVSDGLLFTCSEIARLSGVRFDLSGMSIPLSPEARAYCAENGLATASLLDWGEDYALVFSLSQHDFNRLYKQAGLVCIGMAGKGKGLWLDGKKIESRGYDSFHKN